MSEPRRYIGFGLTLASAIDLPELQPSPFEPDVEIVTGEVPPQGCDPTPDKEIYFERNSAGYQVSGGNRIVVQVFRGADLVQVRRTLLGYVLAILLRQRGWLALHASAVSLQGNAAVFLGRSGMGKSTTAAAFHAAGHEVAADDLAAVRTRDSVCEVAPGLSWVRLLPDAHEVLGDHEGPVIDHRGKRSFGLTVTSRSHAPKPLRALFLLEDADHLQAVRIPPMEAVTVLSHHTQLRAARMKTDILGQHLRMITTLVAAAPVWRLYRPRNHKRLPELVDLVTQQLHGDAARKGTAQT